MIVFLQMAVFLARELFTPEWQKDARDIGREVDECMKEQSIIGAKT